MRSAEVKIRNSGSRARIAADPIGLPDFEKDNLGRWPPPHKEFGGKGALGVFRLKIIGRVKWKIRKGARDVIVQHVHTAELKFNNYAKVKPHGRLQILEAPTTKYSRSSNETPAK